MPPSADEVLTALGDKITFGLGDAVAGAANDLALYRAMLPDFAAEQCSRGLANWIHDRIWARAKANLDDVPDAHFNDRGATHDLWVRTDFRLRAKRHSLTGAIRAYPTPSTLDFISQQTDLFGASTVNLTIGYEWDEPAQQMGDPVISLRDGSFEEVIWMTNLPTSGLAGTVFPIAPMSDSPATPAIDFRGRVDSEGAESQ